MAAIIIPRKWQTQPQGPTELHPDWAAKGLSFVRFGYQWGGANSDSLIATPQGLAGRIYTDTARTATFAPFAGGNSFWLDFTPQTLSGSSYHYLGYCSNGTYRGGIAYFHANSTPVNYPAIYNGAAVSGSWPNPAGLRRNNLSTYTPTGAGTVTCYGSQDGSAEVTIGTMAQTTDTFQFRDLANLGADYAIRTALGFTGYRLTNNDTAALWENPNCIFKPRKQVLYFTTAGGSGTTVTPGAGSIAVSGSTPAISQPRTLAPSSGSVVSLGYAPTVSQGASVSPVAGAIVTLGYAPAISQPRTISPAVGASIVAGYQPTVNQGASVSPAAGTVVTLGYAPAISQPHTVSPSVGAITVTGYAPEISQTIGIRPGAGAIVVAGYTPTISQPRTISPGFGACDILGYAPTVNQSALIQPGVGQIIVQGYAPSIGQPRSIAIGAGAVSLFGYAPTISQIGLTLSADDIAAIANAVWAHPNALTLQKFMGLK